jgi:hypothetical protein
MMKKSLATIFATALLAATGITANAHAATIVNGTLCTKASSSATVKVKGVSKVYLCTGNPSITGAKPLSWTLKTCVNYWSTAQTSQDSINQQRSLIQSMSEPDKTTYNKQLDGSQAQLDKVFAAIKANHCKAGL